MIIYIYSVCVHILACVPVYDISCAFAVVLLYTASSVQWPFFIRVSTPFALLTLFSLQWYNPWAGNSVLEQPVSNNAQLQNCRIGMTCSPQNFLCWPPRSTDPTNMIGYKSYIPLIPGISIPLCHALICILIKLLALPICSLHLGNSNSWSNWNLTHCLTAGHYNYTKELVPPFAMPLGVPKRTGWPGWRDPKVRVHGTEITSYNIDIIDS